MKETLLLFPSYTGQLTLEEVLSDRDRHHLLWLEILLNDRISWENYINQPEIDEAYEKACIWFTQYKTMIQSHTGRKPLKNMTGKADPNDYRKFIEALSFVSALT